MVFPAREFRSLLNNDFTVKRNDRQSDGQGGFLESPVLVGIYKGRVRPASAREASVAGHWQSQVTHVLYMEAPKDIQRHDLVEGAGLVLRVVDVREPSKANEHLEIYCEQVQQGR